MPSDKSSKLEAITELQSLLGDMDIAPQNLEALLQIASMIRLAESFRLGFVKCNQPVQCLQMLERLKEMLASEADVITVNLKEPVSSLRRAVLQALESDSPNAQEKNAIMVLGFERSIPSEGSAPALDELNQSRDNYPKSFSGPFLIWLPDYALTRLAREAPDFWGWRSGVFEFSPEQKTMALVEKTMMQGVEEDRMSLEEKREHASALEGLIRDYQELERGEREDRALAAVLRRLGRIRYQLGEYDAARKFYQQSLKTFQQLDDENGVSKSLYELGILAINTGNYNEARKLSQQSLEMFRHLGDKSGEANSLYALGLIAQNTEDNEEAYKHYQQSLKMFQHLGDKSGEANSLRHLGNLAHLNGDYEEARKLYLQSLKMSKQLGYKSGMSKSLHVLGMLASDLGNYDEARKLYQKSMKILEYIGDKKDISIMLHNLSMLAQDTGDYNEARKLSQHSLEINQELGDKSGVSRSLNQLCILAQDTGEDAEARKLYQQSLEIKQELGDKVSLAMTLAQFSLLEEKEGHLDKAIELIKEAESLFLELKSPMIAQARRDRERMEIKQSQS